MSEDLPHYHHISGVSTQNHSQAFVGSARDVYFADSKNPQEALEQAAIACRKALFLTDPHVDLESVISTKGTRVAGTCEWITHNESYRTWLNSDGNSDTPRLLWISGGPGKGKTMLSVFLTGELKRHTARLDNAELAFFFCSADDEKRNTAIAVLRGLVHQIIAKRPKLVMHALPYFETPERTQQTQLSLEALWLIFSKLVADAELGTMFCVLDGLDECEDSTLRVLLPRIVRLLTRESSSLTKGRLKLAIVSRDLPVLRGCTTRVRLDPDNNDKVVGDIGLFVSTRVRELSRIEGFNEDFRESVQTALLKRAEGTFLWVGFAMHELLQKQTCSEIWEALEKMPSGLSEIYSRMLLRIPTERREVSRAILQWVTIAARPLLLRELAAAVGVQAALPRMTVEHAVRDAIALCGPLLKVQKQKVGFVHQSARDYLLRKERDSDAVLEAFRLNLESAHLELARKCLNCIAQSDLKYAVIDLDTKPNSQMSPLLRYATLYWPEHAKSCCALAAKLFDPSGLFLQEESALRIHWWKIYDKEVRGYQCEPPPLLHMACILEIVPWVEAVLAKKSLWPRYYKHVSKKDNNGRTVLHSAVYEEKEAVVRLLVDRGADVKAKDNNGWTVLHSAVDRDNEALVRLLVDRGADVKAKDNDGETVLYSAVYRGNEAVVRLLVDRGADVKAKDNDGWTVLHSTIHRGNEAVVRLLVDRGADFEAKDNNGRTVLHLAVENWNWSTGLLFAVYEEKEAVVRLLVERGADVKAKDNNGWTVLHSAIHRGNEAVVRLLVDKGADVKAKDNNGWTVLHSAIDREKEALVQMLIDRGADFKAKNNNGRTVLHLAVDRGNEAVMRLLVDRGADVKATDNKGWTVLHSAIHRGNEAMVRLLVDRRADVKTKDNNGWTVLHSAVDRGNEALVRLLVDRGADVEAKDNNGRTVLHFAVHKGNEAVMRLLVDRGADVKATDNKGWTVLHSAIHRGNEAVVRLLVDRGADVKATDNNGWRVLHSAVYRGDEAVVRLLVDRGADVKVKDNNGWTVLHSAVYRENEAVVQLLVDRGANVKAKDKYGWTVLHSAVDGGNEGVVWLLVNRGADIKAKDNNGRTVLHSAAGAGNEAVVRLLVDREADVEAKDNNGRTVLHSAAGAGSEAVVRLLVDREADVEAKDNNGRTVLCLAALGRNKTVVQLLVDRRADLQAKN